jgi:alanyl-tRNA synthetase
MKLFLYAIFLTMTVSEVRRRYLEFFKKQGHTIIPSAPIVPENDPTTLFTSSGMQPMIPYLLGQEHAEGTRIADSQICFRAGDIEEIGDNRHTTFFEMLGNWSFGDYFKREQLQWIFEFLTNTESGLSLDPRNLYVSVFEGDDRIGIPKDDEAISIWKELFAQKGIEAKEITLGSEENGYRVGMQGGRIFAYDAKKNWWSRAGTPAEMPVGEPGGTDSEMFYDFGTEHDTKFGEHCHPNCDCGRFMEIGNSVFMEYLKQADGSFTKLPNRNIDFGGGLERIAAPCSGNADVFLLDVFTAARSVVEKRSGKTYGESAEVTRSFRIILDHMRAASFMLASAIVPGNSEQPYVLRRLIRRAIREADRLGIKNGILPEIAEGYGTAYADQYPLVMKNAQFIREELAKEEDQFRKTLTQGMRELEKMGDHIDAFTLFTTYGFPIELTIEIAKEKGVTVDLGIVKEKMKQHQEESRAGAAQKFEGGLADHSAQTIRYHTAHHLLLKALQTLLGDSVHQRGSNITSERLRIDFNYGAKMTPEQIKQVEGIVNDKIAQGIAVVRTVMSKEDAERLGAEHEFGAKYPEQVSVYSIGPLADAFSIEFCGGPHVGNTSELGEGGKRFKIIKEEASSAGVRRIKAVLQ